MQVPARFRHRVRRDQHDPADRLCRGFCTSLAFSCLSSSSPSEEPAGAGSLGVVAVHVQARTRGPLRLTGRRAPRAIGRRPRSGHCPWPAQERCRRRRCKAGCPSKVAWTEPSGALDGAERAGDPGCGHRSRTGGQFWAHVPLHFDVVDRVGGERVEGETLTAGQHRHAGDRRGLHGCSPRPQPDCCCCCCRRMRGRLRPSYTRPGPPRPRQRPGEPGASGGGLGRCRSARALTAVAVESFSCCHDFLSLCRVSVPGWPSGVVEMVAWSGRSAVVGSICASATLSAWR